MPQITLTFDLSDAAAARFATGITGNDDDVLLALEKVLGALLDVESGGGADVEMSCDMDADEIREQLLSELRENSPMVPNSYLSQLLESWQPTNSFDVERALQRVCIR